MTTLATTAIIVSYRTGPRLHECLYALAYDPAISALLIVDNGNPDIEVAWLRTFAGKLDHVTLIEPGRNLGFGAGVNLAAKQAPDGDLLIINPDAVLAASKTPSSAKMLAFLLLHFLTVFTLDL